MMPLGAKRGGQARVQIKRKWHGRTWGSCLHIRVCGWNASGNAGIRPDCSIQTKKKKSRALLSFTRVLPKEHTKGKPYEMAETLTRAVGEVISGTYICL